MDDFASLTPEEQQAVLDGPAVMPPDGTVSNFENPPNRNTLALVVCIITIVPATLSVLLRLYSRAVCVKRTRIEDALIVLALGSYGALAWCILYEMVRWGYFIHQWDVHLGDLPDWIYLHFIFVIVFAVTMLLAKTAILIEWMRIFVPTGTRNMFFWASQVVMWLNITYYVTFIIVINLSCVPYESIWNVFIHGKCLNRAGVDLSSACVNLVLDLAIFLLPQNVIWKLQMSKSRKLGFSAVFAVGILVCICAAARTAAAVQLTRSEDPWYDACAPTLWAQAEVTCVLLVFCVPALPKAFSDTTMVSRIVGTLRPWTRMPQRSQTSPNKSNSSRARSIRSKPSSVYQKMVDPDPPSHQDIEMMPQKPHAVMHSGNASTDRDGIMLVTEFVTGEETAFQTQDTELLRRQHPWADSMR